MPSPVPTLTLVGPHLTIAGIASFDLVDVTAIEAQHDQLRLLDPDGQTVLFLPLDHEPRDSHSS